MTDPNATRDIDRLRAEIASLRERLADTAGVLEQRSQGVLLAETPLAEHDYRLARDAHERVKRRLSELEAELGGLILDHEARSAASFPAEGRRAG